VARFLVPLIVFLVLVGFLWVGLGRDPHEVPSPLINKPAPTFSLPQLQAPDQLFSPVTMRGQVWLLNVWATWCVSCREEHPMLVQLASSSKVPIIGLNYKEVRGDNSIDTSTLSAQAEKDLAIQRARAWLDQHGNPYQRVAMDLEGRTGIDYGVYGVPETYVIDKQGMIRMKQIGPITAQVWQDKIMPLIQALSR
jgi:cytochrome c biogenesis protein CcmG/thiol:disulfide interchange protein DsbE